MYIVIVGSGRIGYNLVKALLAAGHEVLFVEKDESFAKWVADEISSSILQGDGTDPSVLKKAGVTRADVLIAMSNRDEDNLIVCQMAKKLFNVPQTVALVWEPEHESVFKQLGIDIVVNNTHLIISTLEHALRLPLVHMPSLKAQGIEMISVEVPDESATVGRRVLEIELPPNSFICLVVKGKSAQLPSPEVIVQGGDQIIAVTTSEEEEMVLNILTEIR